MVRLKAAIPAWLVRSAQIAVLIGIVVLLWRSVDWRASLALLAGADLRWLGAAALVLTLQTVLSALRWRITAARLGIVISKLEALREYYLSQVVNQSLPGGMLGDASRAVRARAQAGMLASGQAVVFERVAGQIGLLAVLVAGLLMGLILPAGIDRLLGPVGVAMAALLCLPVGITVALRLSGRTDTALHRTARTFYHAVLARDVRAIQASLSLATAICNVAAFAFCALAIGIGLPVLTLIILVPLILFAMVVPLSISGWGLREGAAAALFPMVGATASAGLATSVAFGLVFLATVLPGLFVTWLRPNTRVAGQDHATYD
jgi:uncharacterized membrane protein YbhN (UPF0104 family)